MTDEFKEKFAKAVTIALLAVIGAGGAFTVWPTYLRGRSLKLQEAELTRSIEEKKREIAAIRDKQRRFTTDREFVESLARENRRVFPNELVFVFED